jgi:hypothetical protein
MKRGTIALVIFAVIAGAFIGFSQFLRNQPPVEITVAVDPLAEDWLRDAVRSFNNAEIRVSSRRVRVNLQIVPDQDVWRERRWTPLSHPDGWIPTSTISLAYARSGNMPLDTLAESIARTPLIWGGFNEAVDTVLAESGAESLDWAVIVNAADNNAVRLAFPLPNSTMTGLAVLWSGAAAFNDTASLSSSALGNAFRNWFNPVGDSVPNFNQIGRSVPTYMATSIGRSSVDIGIAPESQWLMSLSGLSDGDESRVRFSYPAYTYIFDFPVAMWTDTETEAITRDAMRAFADYLLASEQQSSAIRYGLRPATGAITAANSGPFANAQSAGIVLELDTSTIAITPSSSVNDVEALLNWFDGNW